MNHRMKIKKQNFFFKVFLYQICDKNIGQGIFLCSERNVLCHPYSPNMSEVSNTESGLSNASTVTMSLSPTPNELKKSVKVLEASQVMNHVTPAGISRERSFVRTSNPQNHHQVIFEKIK